jgi:MFS family permease
MSGPVAHAPLDESVPPAAQGGRGLILILGALTAIASLAIDMYLPALPEIARDLGIEVGAVQLTLSIFMIGVSVGQAIYGPIADRWGTARPVAGGDGGFHRGGGGVRGRTVAAGAVGVAAGDGAGRIGEHGEPAGGGAGQICGE